MVNIKDLKRMKNQDELIQSRINEDSELKTFLEFNL